MIKALLFDMDGVLLDSSPIHEQAYRATFVAFNLKIEFNYPRNAGKSTINVMSEIASNYPSQNLNPLELTKYKQELVLDLFKDLEVIPLFPEVRNVLIELSSYYSLALCTSASIGTVDAFFKSGVRKELFSEIVTSEQVSKSKPEPDIYLLAMKKLGVMAHECLVIEDSLAGLISGIASGAKVCRIGDVKTLANLPRHLAGHITNFETIVELRNYLRV